MSEHDYFGLAAIVLLGGILGSMIQSICISLRRSPNEPQPRPADPDFDAIPKMQAVDRQVAVVEFRPTVKYDIDIAFNRIVGTAVKQKIDAKIEANRLKQEAEDMLSPIREAFDHLIKTREPMVDGGYMADHLKGGVQKLEIEGGFLFLCKKPSIGFRLHARTGSTYIEVAACVKSRQYEVARYQSQGGSTPEMTNDEYADWKSAFSRALEHISPHILGCDGKLSTTI